MAFVGASLLLACFNVASAVLLPKGAGAPVAPKSHSVTFLNVKGAALSQNTEGTDADRLRRLTGLTEVEQDLKMTEIEEVNKIKKLDQEIITQTKQRNLARKREAQRKHEIAFIDAEIGKLRKRLQVKDGAAAGTAVTAAAGAATGAAASVAASTATSATADQQVVAEANSTETQAAGSVAASGDAAAVADASAAAEASAAAATDSTATETSDSASVNVEQSASQELANIAAQQAQSEEVQQRALQQQKLQEAAAAAERAAVERARKADEERRQQQEIQDRAIAEQRAKDKAAKEDMANSADDSFKNFMKEEDGEDEQGNADYEDSANALAGAIGWNRNEIETNANSAVKQLTEAIGGKKAVASVQGLMAGLR